MPLFTSFLNFFGLLTTDVLLILVNPLEGESFDMGQSYESSGKFLIALISFSGLPALKPVPVFIPKHSSCVHLLSGQLSPQSPWRGDGAGLAISGLTGSIQVSPEMLLVLRC